MFFRIFIKIIITFSDFGILSFGSRNTNFFLIGVIGAILLGTIYITYLCQFLLVWAWIRKWRIVFLYYEFSFMQTHEFH